MALSGLNRARNEGRGGKGPHRVMDEHDLRLGGRECGEQPQRVVNLLVATS